MLELLELLIVITIFFMGMIWGSFFNVVVFRLPRNLPIVNGRSMCPSCGTQLRWFDLIPLLSWLFCKRKCRYCAGAISWRYPIMELVTGVFFLVSYLAFGLTLQALYCIISLSVLLIIGLIDFDEKLIYNGTTIFLGVSSAAFVFLLDKPIYEHISGLLLGLFLWGAVYWLSRWIYKREALGSGDVWLMAAVGILLGFSGTIITSLLAIYLAAIVLVFMRIFGKKIMAKQEIPLGTFICIASGITLFFEQQILSFYFSLF